jgi:hypothetical protein
MFSEPSQVYIDLLRFLFVLKAVRGIFIMLNWSFFLFPFQLYHVLRAPFNVRNRGSEAFIFPLDKSTFASKKENKT